MSNNTKPEQISPETIIGKLSVQLENEISINIFMTKRLDNVEFKYRDLRRQLEKFIAQANPSNEDYPMGEAGELLARIDNTAKGWIDLLAEHDRNKV